MKAGNVFVGIAQLELMENIVPYPLRGAGGKGGNRLPGKMRAQPAQLPIFRTELVSPLGNAMRLVDGKK